jgi:hypothetical protein
MALRSSIRQTFCGDPGAHLLEHSGGMSQMSDSAWALVGLQLFLNERDDGIWPFHVASITGGAMAGSLYG